MCGICGKYIYHDSAAVSRTSIRKMTAGLIHRGPDQRGIYVSGPVGLGVRRLCILDPQRGTQPMYNEDRSVVLAFNGEIYNHAELRQRLAGQGHNFRSRSDTEVIVHLYEEEGIGCISSLNGMFAFALWDASQKRLYLVRDRLGIKPLFYSVCDKDIVFASEIKSLLCEPALPREVDTGALSHFMSYNYVPSPLTLFKGIHKLPPGSCMECTSEGTRIKQYWDLDFSVQSRATDEERIGRLAELLQQSVRRRLMGDVPCGLFLSGGIDSSALLGLLESSAGQGLKTFSLSFADSRYNQAAHIRAMTRRFSTDHTEIPFQMNDPAGFISTVVRALEGNVANVTALPLYRLCEGAKKEVTVALSGLGGDEIMAGYDTYLAGKLAPLYCALPRVLRRFFMNLVSLMPTGYPVRSWQYKIPYFMRGAEHSPEFAHYWWRQVFSEEEKKLMFARGVMESAGLSYGFYRQAFAAQKDLSHLHKCLYADTKIWLSDSELMLNDLIGMSHALEVRFPFLDHTVVEYMACLPERLKIRFLRTKYILRRITRHRLPRSVRSQKKRGFTSPLNQWIKYDLKPFICDTINKRAITQTGLFRAEYVLSLLSSHFKGRADHSRKIWALLQFFLWYELFIEDK